MSDRLQLGEFQPVTELAIAPRFRTNFVRKFESRDLTEEEFFEQIIETIEQISGPLSEWQKFYICGVVSGRGVEWSQTRRGPHYHIVGLPCPICRRR